MMDSPLFQRLHDQNPDGIPFEDAKQLFLWTFCTLNILPATLREEVLDKETLAKIFSQLSREGIVSVPKQEYTSDSELEGFWVGLVREFLLNRIELDSGFRERSSRYF